MVFHTTLRGWVVISSFIWHAKAKFVVYLNRIVCATSISVFILVHSTCHRVRAMCIMMVAFAQRDILGWLDISLSKYSAVRYGWRDFEIFLDQWSGIQESNALRRPSCQATTWCWNNRPTTLWTRQQGHMCCGWWRSRQAELRSWWEVTLLALKSSKRKLRTAPFPF